MPFAIAEVFSIGAKLIDRVIPDPKLKYEATQRLIELNQTGELAVLSADKEIALGQSAINIKDAESDDKVQKRWRPFIGWVCGFIFAMHFMVFPLLFWVGLMVEPTFPKPPTLEIEQVMTVLMGMLGLGGFRTFEKIRGKA